MMKHFYAFAVIGTHDTSNNNKQQQHHHPSESERKRIKEHAVFKPFEIDGVRQEQRTASQKLYVK